MADKGQDGSSSEETGDPAALGLSLGGASRAQADEYLRKQSRLADLQIDTLEKKDEFELSHLRFRRFSDYARFVLEISIGLVVLLIICGLGTMVWSASQDHDLVVNAFSVPQDVAQSGLTGGVLAGRVLDRFGHMQAMTRSTTQGAGSYRADTGDAVRVEIPDTGVSIGELNRYMRAWLGHETHVTGDLVHTPGGYALTTRFGAQPGSTAEAKTDKLDTLIQKSAEQIYAAALPYRYVEYLVSQSRFAEAMALAPGLAASGTNQNRALANSAWANAYFYQGDMQHALEKGREAVRLDPENPVAHAWLSVAESNLGHDEGARANIAAALQYWDALEKELGAQQAALFYPQFTGYLDEVTGDFADALAQWRQLAALGQLSVNSIQSLAGDANADHDLAAARRVIADAPDKDRTGRPSRQKAEALFFSAYSAQDWQQAVVQGKAMDALLHAQPDQRWSEMLAWPELAEAMAHAGDRKDADALIAKTPRDCDDCLRKRGCLAALEGRFAEAAQDFATVAARSPQEPFAETDWGEMLMSRGDFDGAIAKFEIANQKGPHFADPLEMWGEALIRKNRSDLALAKFAEAEKYAPKWGRLHLKWGEALLWSGDKMGAAKQFAAARSLDLTSPEARECAKLCGNS